jgi:hypothetical protein
MHDPAPATSAARPVDNTDWLKTAAIILATVDHFGHFFMDDDRWWSAFGRLAAPSFFFLLGYAQTRTVPLRWVVLGVILTLLESWNESWTWVTPNILLSLALIRSAHPYVQVLLQRHGWVAFVLMVAVLVAVLPMAARIVDYGSEGWLWALLGVCQRVYVDGRSDAGANTAAPSPSASVHALTKNVALMRLLACLVAAVVYVWQEQREFSFPRLHLAVFILGLGVLSACLCLFRRGPSRIQPPEAMGGALRFIGRRTLEIYAIQLAGFELIVKFLPDLGTR